MNQAELAKKMNWKYIQKNEIVIEFDDYETEDKQVILIRPKQLEAVNSTSYNLAKAGYCFEVWYAEGQRSCHIHLKNFPEPLSQVYKEAFIKKYVPSEWLQYADLKMCEPNHLVAAEGRLHYKYKTPKLLIHRFNENFANYIEPELVERSTIKEIERPKLTPNEYRTTLSAKIAAKILITAIADQFGLEPFDSSKRVCPFHADGHPSLSLDNSRGWFKCFGCQAHGGIVKFYAMLKEINPNFRFHNKLPEKPLHPLQEASQ